VRSISNKSCPSSLHDNANLDATALDPLVLLPLGLLDPHLLLRLMLLLLVVLLAVLLLPTVLHLLLLARIPARHRVRSSVMRLPILRMLRLMLLPVIESRHLRRPMPTTSLPQVDVDSALILLSIILQPQLPTNLLNFRLDLLHMPNTMIPFTHNNVQMPLPRLLRVPDALLQYLLCFLDELAVQVDGVGVDAADGVVFAENVLRGLFV
jgi:hypothetical protein